MLNPVCLGANQSSQRPKLPGVNQHPVQGNTSGDHLFKPTVPHAPTSADTRLAWVLFLLAIEILPFLKAPSKLHCFLPLQKQYQFRSLVDASLTITTISKRDSPPSPLKNCFMKRKAPQQYRVCFLCLVHTLFAPRTVGTPSNVVPVVISSTIFRTCSMGRGWPLPHPWDLWPYFEYDYGHA